MGIKIGMRQTASGSSDAGIQWVAEGEGKVVTCDRTSLDKGFTLFGYTDSIPNNQPCFCQVLDNVFDVI